MALAVLITGGNTGDVEAGLARAEAMIAGRVGKIAARSGVKSSAPWGGMEEGTEPFLNQVLAVETRLEPEELLGVLQQIERELGRVRPERFCEEVREERTYASRTMDIDILFYDDIVMRTGRLSIPHPLIGERKFVLEPLAEAMPQLVHPVTGMTAAQMLAELKKRGKE